MNEPSNKKLRNELVNIALLWQKRVGVAPQITSAIAEYDAAILIGMSDMEIQIDGEVRTAVTKGHDFTFKGDKYQVKANRPSGRRGSKVTLVGNPKNDEWNYLIWILYDTGYNIQEAWQWSLKDFRKKYSLGQRLHPNHLRDGLKLHPQD